MNPVTIGVWLIGLVTPLVRRVLVALGIGLVTYTGLDYILSQVQSLVIASMGGMTGASAQVAAILGFQQSVGIILGALSARLALTQLTKWGRS